MTHPVITRARLTSYNAMFVAGLFTKLWLGGTLGLIEALSLFFTASISVPMAINLPIYAANKSGLRLLFRKAGDEAFHFANDVETQNSAFALRVRDIVDELKHIEEGRRLLDEAAGQDLIVCEAETVVADDLDTDPFGNFVAEERRANLIRRMNEITGLFANTLIHEVGHGVQPYPSFVSFPAGARRASITLREGDAFSLPPYLAWRLKEAGRPRLWVTMAHAELKQIKFGFTDFEKFELAMGASQNPAEARQKFIRDWCMGKTRHQYLEKTRYLDYFSLGKIPSGAFGALKWLALLPEKIFSLGLTMLPMAAMDILMSNTPKAHRILMERFWDSAYLHAPSANIPPLMESEFSYDDVELRYWKEIILKDPASLAPYLKDYFTGSSKNPFASLAPEKIWIADGIIRGAADELRSYAPKRIGSIEDLWAGTEAMPDPVSILNKHTRNYSLG